MTELSIAPSRLFAPPTGVSPDEVATAVLVAAVAKARGLVRSNLGVAARNVLNDAIRTAETVLEVA